MCKGEQPLWFRAVAGETVRDGVRPTPQPAYRKPKKPK